MSTIQIQKKKQLTFEEICPEWSEALPEVIHTHMFWKHGKLDIADSRYCVVGEAHGFTNEYWQPTSKKYCQECDEFSSDFCDPAILEDAKILFTNHWNEVHLNK